jgi:hypothetical protein
LLVIVVQFTLCLWTSFSFELLLPSKCPWLCHRSTFAFKGHLLSSKGICRRRNSSCCHRRVIAVERPLPSKDICHRRAFAIEGHLPSKGLCHRSALPSMCPWLCHRRALPSKCLCLHGALVFAIDGLLPSKLPCLCHRWAVAFKVHLPLASKGLCHRTPFAFKGPLPSKGLRHRMAIGIEGPFLLYVEHI